MGNEGEANVMAEVAFARGVRFRDWRSWASHAAVAWSVVYAGLGVYWAISGRGFPYALAVVPDPLGPLLARFWPGVAWDVVMTAGAPAAAMGAAMLHGAPSKALRPFLLAGGTLLAGVVLLLMTGLNLLVLFGYVPYVLVDFFTTGRIGQKYLADLTRWPVLHQLLCFVGGFLWLAATVSYARRSGTACSRCGRLEHAQAWRRPSQAARWGRLAVAVSMVAPAFYALTRYAWALGFPLGLGAEQFRRGQERGLWTSGLFLANFGLVGALLTLGLVQRWGEAFPRWMIGLAGRRVPIALAVVPASLVSVLLVVGGVVLWSGLGQMVARLAAGGTRGTALVGGVTFVFGPVLLFPVWGVALAVAALAYHDRRRGPCPSCGHGV